MLLVENADAVRPCQSPHASNRWTCSRSRTGSRKRPSPRDVTFTAPAAP